MWRFVRLLPVEERRTVDPVLLALSQGRWVGVHKIYDAWCDGFSDYVDKTGDVDLLTALFERMKYRAGLRVPLGQYIEESVPATLADWFYALGWVKPPDVVGSC